MFHLSRLMLIVYFIKSIETKTFISFKSVGYYIGGQVESYSKAESQCEKENATLAIVNNKAIRDFLVNILTAKVTAFPYSCYVGLKLMSLDNNEIDAFQWIDGTSLSDGYEDWGSGEPNNLGNNERCVIMGWLHELDSDFKWRDVECNTKSRFICQKSFAKAAATTSNVTFTTYDTILATSDLDTFGSAESPTTDSTTQKVTTTRTTNASPLIENLHWILIGVAGLLVVCIIVTTYLHCKQQNRTSTKINIEERKEEFSKKEHSSYIAPVTYEATNILYESSGNINTDGKEVNAASPQYEEVEGNYIPSVMYDEICLAKPDESTNTYDTVSDNCAPADISRNAKEKNPKRI